MTWNSEQSLWLCEYLFNVVAFLSVLERAVIVHVTFKTTEKLFWRNYTLPKCSHCCQSVWVGGECCETCPKCRMAKVTQTENFTQTSHQNIVAEAAQRWASQSGTRARLCCGWQHAAGVFFLQSVSELEESCLTVSGVEVVSPPCVSP